MHLSTAAIQVLALGTGAVSLLAITAYRLIQRCRNPIERERRRRISVYRTGRMGEGLVTDRDESCIHYQYNVHGVVYSTAQEISLLKQYMPADSHPIVGNCRLKYLAANPGNSIVVCEYWSGFQAQPEPISKESEQ